MFGQVVRSPWVDLRQGLVLGGESLWNMVRELVAKAEGAKEIGRRRRADAEASARAIASLLDQEADRRVAIWLRVGGERMTTVAADYGYRDGSGVHRVIKRLEEKAKRESRPVAPSKGPSQENINNQKLTPFTSRGEALAVGSWVRSPPPGRYRVRPPQGEVTATL